MVDMIKSYFPNNPTVCAIGTGNKDALMMAKSDISFEIQSRLGIPPNYGSK